jgi:hypothetical protein
MYNNGLGLSVFCLYVYMYICIHIHVYGLSINIVNLVNKWQAIKGLAIIMYKPTKTVNTPLC